MAGQVSPLGRLIDDRRAELGLTLGELAETASLSVEALRAIRYGENEPRDLTMGAIDRGLRWKPGSVERFLGSGTAPLPRDEAPPGPDRAAAAAVLFPDDEVAQKIVSQTGKPRERIHSELANWLAQQAGAAEAQQ